MPETPIPKREDKEGLLFRDADEYLERRVRYKVNAYTKKGDRYRWGYLILASVAAVAAATVPVLINLEVDRLIPTLLSLLVTVVVGLEGLFHFREHWKNYDLMKTFLRQEANLFQVGSGPYRKVSGSDEAFKLFVERVEEEIAKERAQTIQMRTARTPEPEQPREGPPEANRTDGAGGVPPVRNPGSESAGTGAR